LLDPEFFSRTKLLIGEEGVERLHNAKIALFGLGGVGGYACEALVRSGIGNLIIVDFDSVSKSNFNRQIFALHSTLGRKKTEVAKERLLDINPNLNIRVYDMLFNRDIDNEIFESGLNYVVDAIDSLNPKCELIERAVRFKIPIISAMGAAGKTDDTLITQTTLWKTEECPLARKLRQRLRRRGITDDEIFVVYSKEQPHGNIVSVEDISENADTAGRTRNILPSMAILPAVMGLKIANKVILDLLKPLDINHE